MRAVSKPAWVQDGRTVVDEGRRRKRSCRGREHGGKGEGGEGKDVQGIGLQHWKRSKGQDLSIGSRVPPAATAKANKSRSCHCRSVGMHDPTRRGKESGRRRG